MTILVDNCSTSSSNNEPKGEAEEATETALGDYDDEEMARECVSSRKSGAVDAGTTNKVKSSSGDEQPFVSLSSPAPPLLSTEPVEGHITDSTTTLHINNVKTDTLGMPHAILKDPITNMRMVDPVVNSAGDSYERSSLLLTDERIEFYPNRALQAMLKQQDEYETQRATESANNSVAAGCWWYHDVNTPKGAQLTEAFYCPITCDIMVDPWIGPDGCTYEYDGIQAWLEQCNTEACSPVTRQALCLGQFRPNQALYELIQWETQLPPLQRHVAIQKWMDSTRRTTRSPRLHHPPPTPPRAAATAAATTTATPVSSAPAVTTSNPRPDSTRTNATRVSAETNDATRSKSCRKCLYTCLGIVFLFLVAYLVFPLSFAVACVVAALIFLACHCGTSCDE
jgi:U-box domain